MSNKIYIALSQYAWGRGHTPEHAEKELRRTGSYRAKDLKRLQYYVIEFLAKAEPRIDRGMLIASEDPIRVVKSVNSQLSSVEVLEQLDAIRKR